MPWYMRIQNISRSAIWVALVVAFAIPLFHPLGMPLNITKATEAAYNFIDSLPADSVVLVSVGFNPAVDAECWPQMVAITRHMMSKHLRIVYYPYMQEGGMYAQRVKDSVSGIYGYEYGKDYVILPFKAGGETAIAGMKDWYTLFSADASGNPIKDMPVFQGFRGPQDLAAIVPVTGSDDPIFYVRYIEPAYHTPIVACGTAPLLPVVGPFVASKQIKSTVIGLSGAAEYEVLAKVPGSATGAMDAQAMGHMLIVLLIALGNIGFFFQKRAQKAAGVTSNG